MRVRRQLHLRELGTKRHGPFTKMRDGGKSIWHPPLVSGKFPAGKEFLNRPIDPLREIEGLGVAVVRAIRGRRFGRRGGSFDRLYLDGNLLVVNFRTLGELYLPPFVL